MNQLKDKQQRAVAAPRKITKGEIQKALDLGITHATMANKGVNKRLKKQQQKIRRKQELRENAIRLQNKALEEAKKRQAPADGKYPEGVKGAVQKVVDESISQGAEELRKLTESMELRVQAPDPEEVQFDNAGPRGEDNSEALQALLAPSAGEVASQALTTLANAIRPVNKGASVNDIIANTPAEPGPLEVVGSTEKLEHVFSDGTVDTNDDPKNFGRQSVDLESGDDVNTRAILIPYNLYGNETIYKPLPEIGDHIREDGLLMAVCAFVPGREPKSSELAKLLEVDRVYDEQQFATPNALVTEEVLSKIDQEDRKLAIKYIMKAHIGDNSVLNAYPQTINWDEMQRIAEITKTAAIPSDILFDQGLSIRENIGEIDIAATYPQNSFTDANGAPIDTAQTLELLDKKDDGQGAGDNSFSLNP